MATLMLSVACIAAVFFPFADGEDGQRSAPGLSQKRGKVGRGAREGGGVGIKGIACSQFYCLVTS